MTTLYDVAIDRKAIFPMCIFTDPHKGKHSGGRFFCFIGAYWPVNLFSSVELNHCQALEFLKGGKWREMALEQDPDRKYIGYGVGKTPSEAFRNACFMSGHLNRVQT